MIELKVETTATFADMEAVEDFLRSSGGFQPDQAVELLEERTLTIEEEDPNELAVRPTKNVFTITEVK